MRYKEFVADVTLAAQISLTQRRRISCLLLAHSTKTLPTELGVKKKEKEQLLFKHFLITYLSTYLDIIRNLI